MDKVYLDEDYNRYRHFFSPRTNITLCNINLDPFDKSEYKKLAKNTKQKVNCSRCIKLVESCKAISESEHIKLSEIGD